MLAERRQKKSCAAVGRAASVFADGPGDGTKHANMHAAAGTRDERDFDLGGAGLVVHKKIVHHEAAPRDVRGAGLDRRAAAPRASYDPQEHVPPGGGYMRSNNMNLIVYLLSTTLPPHATGGRRE